MEEDNEKNAGVELIRAIDNKLEKVHTQALDLSFNELLDMASNGELDISPEYQRLFRWSEGARSRFVESLLLEMPVPPIYVVEEDDGKYQLIDGLQRISSYLHLRGLLNAPHLKVAMGEKLEFVDCDIVQELNGKTFDNLPTALQIRLKRAFIRVEVVRKGSDRRFKYHMFKRLNTGGMLLTNQQLRNCTIRMLDPRFNEFILELSKNSDFEKCTTYLSEEQRLGAYDVELVLRYFALKNYQEQFKHDIGDFLTEYMELVSEEKLKFDYNIEQRAFELTFKALATTLGEYAFSYANRNKSDLVKAFGIYQFEAFTIGLQSRLEEINSAAENLVSNLGEILKETKLTEEFRQMTTGGGKNSPGKLKERIEYVQRVVESNVDEA